ncbi:sigma factor-like helix-turn-helix DNA-binding protein [Ornithinibacillus gellani]|uniref:sigma factor-like helix-turn-helix DNA-binding protein n=1 Tax=Ornithinibacillus gellani TaxID=2293253 RepID=UPI0037C5C589
MFIARLLFYTYNELKITEIARHVNENENTIKSRLVRGRRQLRIMLEREERIDGEQQTKYS